MNIKSKFVQILTTLIFSSWGPAICSAEILLPPKNPMQDPRGNSNSDLVITVPNGITTFRGAISVLPNKSITLTRLNTSPGTADLNYMAEIKYNQFVYKVRCNLYLYLEPKAKDLSQEQVNNLVKTQIPRQFDTNIGKYSTKPKVVIEGNVFKVYATFSNFVPGDDDNEEDITEISNKAYFGLSTKSGPIYVTKTCTRDSRSPASSLDILNNEIKINYIPK